MKTTGGQAPAADGTLRGADDSTRGGLSASKAVELLYERHPELGRLDRKQLAAAARARRVPADLGSRAPRFTLAELEPALAELACKEPAGCERVTFGESGYCARHVRGATSRGKPRPQHVREAIAKTKREKPHRFTLEQLRKMDEKKKRKQPGERRWCKWCDEQIKPKRKGLDDVPDAVIAELGFDLVPGSVIAKGGGRFCSNSHHLLWEWANEPDKFPQNGPGPSVFACNICGREVERYPSQEQNRKAAGYRFICSVCDPIYRRYYHMAARKAEGAEARAPFSQAPLAAPSATTLAALDQVWTDGEEFEQWIRKKWPHARGRRPPLCVDLVIAIFHRRDFTDTQVAGLLNRAVAIGRTIPGVRGDVVFDAKYVEQRRRRANIRRRPLRSAQPAQ